jgi:hypothetical protein
MADMRDEIVWIPIEVAIRRNSDGEVRVYQYRGTRDDDGKFNDFIWCDGNFACDCNRYGFFERASGREPDDEESENAPCGDTAYSIDYIKDLETGEVVYSEN